MQERKIHRTSMIRCTLCYDAPCSRACDRMDPAALLRRIWFHNEETAASEKCAG